MPTFCCKRCYLDGRRLLDTAILLEYRTIYVYLFISNAMLPEAKSTDFYDAAMAALLSAIST